MSSMFLYARVTAAPMASGASGMIRHSGVIVGFAVSEPCSLVKASHLSPISQPVEMTQLIPEAAGGHPA